MEELLNKLIEKGWKPYGYKVKDMENWTPDQPCKWLERTNMEDGCVNVRSYRDICSKESGLWQFVCENGFVPKDERVSWRKIDEDGDYINHYSKYREKGSDVGYRLIESSLKDESELEQFLLDNIKVE